MKFVTDKSLFDLKSVAQVMVARDEAFFVETSIREKENDYATTIKSVHLKSKKETQWGDNGSVNTSIGLSNDKQFLSYLSNDDTDKKMQLRIMNISGGSAITLTQEKDGVGQYLWAKNSKSIYYIATQTLENSAEEKDKKPKPVIIDNIIYQNDGSGIFPVDRKYVLKKVSIDTKEIKTVYTFDFPIQLAYVSQKENYVIYNQIDRFEDEFAFGKSTPYKLLISSKKITKLVDIDGPFNFVASNPKETTFIVSGNTYEYQFVTQTNLFAYDVKTKKLKNLTQDIDLEIGDVLVSDSQQQVKGVDVIFIDDNTFIFSATEHGKIQLYTLTLDGKLAQLIDERIHITSAVYNASQNEIVMTYNHHTKPSAVGVFNVKTRKLLELYNPNSTFEKETMLVEPEMYYFKGYDNWDIQAWYLKPSITKGNKKYPFVLYIHGGPQVAYGECFFHEMQSLAAKGYAVLMINPRGGNGYGQQFVASILGDYGNHDYDDLMFGVDDALKRDKQIDTKRLFVTGGSYGGFMTNWIVGHTNRFKAAVTQRSISNWISFYGVSDIGFAFVENQLHIDLSNMQRLWELSPLAYAQNVKTPLLILHGQTDLRCPLEQAQQLYTALKRQSIDTKLITFPQSSHGLSRDGLPNLRLERLVAISDWFKQHNI